MTTVCQSKDTQHLHGAVVVSAWLLLKRGQRQQLEQRSNHAAEVEL